MIIGTATNTERNNHSSDNLEGYDSGGIPNDFIGSQEITRSYFQRTQDGQDETGKNSNDEAEINDKYEGKLETHRNSTSNPPVLKSSDKESVTSIPGLFSSRVRKERKYVLLEFLKNWLVLSVGLLCIFSIYWGALYNRPKYFKNFNMLVVIEDSVIDGVQPLIGELTEMLALLDKLQENGHYHIYHTQDFQQKHHGVRQENGSFNTTQEIYRLIHHQKYWFAIHVKPNTTYSLFEALRTSNASYDANKDPNYSVDAIYETARDTQAMNSTVSPLLQIFKASFSPAVVSRNVYAPLVRNLTILEKQNLINTAPELLSNIVQIQKKDNLPVLNSVLTAPSQVGMIFLIIVTFFQFNFFAPTHQVLAQRVKKSHFVAYRMISSILSYFVLSLVYSWVSLAFQVDFEKAFGHSGFLVYWMTCFLAMAAVGGANENMALFIIPLYPPLLGFWLLFWVISNISPTFFPMASLNRFYKYGYAFPIHNAAELFKVILNDSYKGQMGRNYGILIAWIVINNLLFPFALRFFGRRMAKKAAAGKL